MSKAISKHVSKRMPKRRAYRSQHHIGGRFVGALRIAGFALSGIVLLLTFAMILLEALVHWRR